MRHRFPISTLIKRNISFRELCIAIPVVFFVLKLIQADPLISRETADFIVQILGSVWPTLPPQYQEFVRLGRHADATSYALFYVCLFLSISYVLQKIIRVTIANRTRIEHPKGGLLPFIIFVSIFGVLYGMLWDEVKVKAVYWFDFRVDPFGFYYFRQWFVFGGIYLTVILLVPISFKWIEKVTKLVRSLK